MFAASVAPALRADNHVNGRWRYTNQMVNGQKVNKPWSALVDRPVVVEGLAWGAYAKGLGSHVQLSDAQIYLRNLELLKHDVNGRLIRVEGILRREHVEAVSTFSQGSGKAYDYFYIEVQKWQPIERVEHPWLRDAQFIKD
jgi:hypothetical protein